MPLRALNLDDRNFDELLAEAQREIEKACPAWSDRSPSDPGMVLLEVFAHLTETMIYRLNRLPEKAYIEFLRMIGLTPEPPSAAKVDLTFSLSKPATAVTAIPRGTRVTVTRSDSGTEPIVFATVRPGQISAGELETQVIALQCELVDGELVGTGTGLPGLVVTVARPPIILPSGGESDLVVGVEPDPREQVERLNVRLWAGKTFRVWREVDNFANLGADSHVYVVDRMAGRIKFAPALRSIDSKSGLLAETQNALAAIPGAGREIHAWYRRGGGPAGNVAAGTLTTLKDQIPGVAVTNRKPGVGGLSAESVENALIRGPQELHSLRRAVTARDFQLVALRSSGAVARATAFTEVNLWSYARPGTVRVVMVPSLPEAEREQARITPARLHECDSQEALAQIQDALDERRPLGTTCVVSWARYKTVRVKARVVAHVEEDIDALKSHVLSRLYKSISPLASAGIPGWRFGEALRVSRVYDVALSEPGVSYVDQVSLLVDDVPEKDVTMLAVDFFQPHTWYAGSGGIVFRSVDDGDGWEMIAHFADERVSAACAHPERAGLLAVSTRLTSQPGSRIHLSRNCGESWEMRAETAFIVESMAWTVRDGGALLLLATDVGLYELALQPDASPVQVFVHPGDQEQGFYAVAAASDIRGWVNVAVAARGTGGVFYSYSGGRANSFRTVGLVGEDVRQLVIERDALRSFLWAGRATDVAGGAGKGCSSLELLGEHDSPDGWQPAEKGWDGGSCRGLAVQSSKILAATHHKGVLQITPRQADSAWEKPAIGCRLPLREAEEERLFYPVDAVAAHPKGGILLAAGPMGIYRSASALGQYECCSSRVFTDKVTLPPTWLFCSGEHQIEMVYEHGTGQD
ncbi:MAG: putative baseplate assembly protein [Stellaceae bacterium]